MTCKQWRTLRICCVCIGWDSWESEQNLRLRWIPWKAGNETECPTLTEKQAPIRHFSVHRPYQRANDEDKLG